MMVIMKKLLLVLALLVLPASARAADGSLTPLSSTPIDARQTELTFSSPSLVDPVHVRVVVPAEAAANPGARYPALYLLHGSPGSAAASAELDVEELTAGKGLVVVMPDGGDDGWYTDWPNHAQPRWETFHVRELIPWIEAHEPVIAARSKRAVAGVSMGGFGAMSYAARHPDVFAAAASFSGAVDLGTPPGSGPSIVGVEPWGPWAGPEIAWRGHNPKDLAANLRGVGLQILFGDGYLGPDDLETRLSAQSRSLADALASLGIPRQVTDLGPVGHQLETFNSELATALPGLLDRLNHPVDPPTRWSFRATEQRWSMRGYTLRSIRDALAWRALSSVRAGGFRVTTDAATTITTSKRYARHARYRVVARLASGKVVRDVQRATAEGRLVVKVRESARVEITRVAGES
jgi:S-formylglutathione hydrolase FrmB